MLSSSTKSKSDEKDPKEVRGNKRKEKTRVGRKKPNCERRKERKINMIEYFKVKELLWRKLIILQNRQYLLLVSISIQDVHLRNYRMLHLQLQS
jgi:hypothetical protein